QVLRPRLGYGSDLGGRRTPWIIGGMVVLGAGAVGAALATAMMPAQLWLGIACAVIAFLAIGIGVGACGTNMLVLLSTSVPKERLAAAATVTWVMMIIGFIITTVVAGKMLEPFSLGRLVEVTTSVAAAAFLLTCLAVFAWPIKPTVFLLGLANGGYAVAAIGSMMGLVGRGRESREGTRMGLWGAAQALAFGIGGIAATGAVDLARALTGSLPAAYGAVFVAEAALFIVATAFAVRLSREDTQSSMEIDVQGTTAAYVVEAGRG
ncbi:MAG: hypothetical protein EBX78_04135, partial [Gammaproteobacteria bacterium]|nr:hypothetical protein [Gammaproteobacteria bacterium]